MPHSIKALITPSLIKWSREQAGLDIPTAAKRIGRPENEIQEWENGTLSPTLAQARKAADVYQRALAVFYLPEPPKGFQTLREFRHLPNTQAFVYSSELAQLIRQTEYRQNWLSEWLSEVGMEPLDFVGAASPENPATDVAITIRARLGITINQQMNCSTRGEALNLWIEKCEEIGINICRQTGIECEEARGFVLTDKYAPFIFINSDDAIIARLFTLAHELAHLWINMPGISNMEGLNKTSKSADDQIEIYCNQVASLVLLDEDTFKALWDKSSPIRVLEERIAAVSEWAKVSEEVVARRLLDKGKISYPKYSELRNMFKDRWKRFKMQGRLNNRSKKGFPSPHLLKVLKNGRIFTRTVLSSYFGGRLSGADASSLLNSKINHFSKVAERAGLIFTGKVTYGE